MKLIFPVISILLISALAFATMYENAENADVAIDKVLEQASNYVTEKYKFEVIGTGVSFPNGSLKGMGLSLQINRQFSKDKAKKIVLDIGNFMKNKINESPILIKQMENPPFSIKNITVRVFFTDNQGYAPIHPDFVVVSLIEGEFRTKTQESPDSFDYFCVTSEKVEID